MTATVLIVVVMLALALIVGLALVGSRRCAHGRPAGSARAPGRVRRRGTCS